MFLRKIKAAIISTVVIPVVCFVMLFSFTSFQGSEDINEPTVKALFIYNFTKYVEWSKEKYITRFVIGVYGSTPVINHLKQVCTGRKIKGKEIDVQLVSAIDEADKCDVLFIPKCQNISMEKIKEAITDKEVLVITEENGMALKGSAINIVEVKDKFGFEINESAMKQTGLKASSQLLTLAVKIKQ